MRRIRIGGLAVVVMAACAVVLAPTAAQAATSTHTCSATALVRPILGSGPACTTAPDMCPPESVCDLGLKVAATQLLGLGATAAKGTVRTIGGPDRNSATCSGAARCVGSNQENGIETGAEVDYQALCFWNAGSINVLARVDCSLTLVSGPLGGGVE